MSEQKKFTEKTSADSKSIGFDYQYYFFLWKLLALKPGESVGLEVLDDVHTTLDNDAQILYQIKHTVKVSKSGAPANLTEYDADLWKTLSNWAKVTSDNADGRSSDAEQFKFLEKTDFVLASNKSDSGTNFQKLIDKVKDGGGGYDEISSELHALKRNTESDTIKGYIEDVLSLNPDVLLVFLMSINFELGEEDIFKKCKNEIKAKMIPEQKVDVVFSGIDSAVRKDNFLAIKGGNKIAVTFDVFYLKYRRHYDLARNENLPVYEFSGAMPGMLEEQVFIKQLVELGELLPSDQDMMIELTRHRLKMQNNINLWSQEGELTSEEINRLKVEAITRWRNEFRRNYRGSAPESEYNNIGLNVLDEVRNVNLVVSGQQLDLDMSNGEFYELSNIPEIGWRFDWEKYKE